LISYSRKETNKIYLVLDLTGTPAIELEVRILTFRMAKPKRNLMESLPNKKM
jgi:hypothetical protein